MKAQRSATQICPSVQPAASSAEVKYDLKLWSEYFLAAAASHLSNYKPCNTRIACSERGLLVVPLQALDNYLDPAVPSPAPTKRVTATLKKRRVAAVAKESLLHTFETGDAT